MSGRDVDPRLKKGLEFFNAGRYFESHEAVESLWLEIAQGDPHRDFYKGIIQAAAALYQWERGVESGARGLSRSSISHLAHYAPTTFGLNVAKLIDGVQAYFSAVLEGKTAAKPLVEEMQQ